MRVLVTGASGLVGSNVAAAATQQSWDVLGCFHEHPVEIEGAHTLGLDIADRKACVNAAMEWEPDVIVHAAPNPLLTRFERDPFLAQLDFVGAEHTLAAARTVRARYVLVSCDSIHSGRLPPGMRFQETDLPNPLNAHGRSKLACEEAVMRSNTSWLITRPGEVYGINASRPRPLERIELALSARPDREQADIADVWERSGLALRLVKRLRTRATITAPHEVWRTPTYARDYAHRLCELIAQGCEGIYNAGGPISLTRHEWVGLLAREFSCSPELVREGTTGAYLRACGEDPRVRIPSNTALSDTKARAAIGLSAVAPERGVRSMREQLSRMHVPVGADAR
ncbi:MAG TPA: sugar nucleotide-binding protein [Solirubrobacteraceae bacterium]